MEFFFKGIGPKSKGSQRLGQSGTAEPGKFFQDPERFLNATEVGQRQVPNVPVRPHDTPAGRPADVSNGIARWQKNAAGQRTRAGIQSVAEPLASPGQRGFLKHHPRHLFADPQSFPGPV